MLQLIDQESAVLCHTCGARLHYTREEIFRNGDRAFDWQIKAWCQICGADPTKMALEALRREHECAVERHYNQTQERQFQRRLGESLNQALNKAAFGETRS
jgi:hypothetical protein